MRLFTAVAVAVGGCYDCLLALVSVDSFESFKARTQALNQCDRWSCRWSCSNGVRWLDEALDRSLAVEAVDGSLVEVYLAGNSRGIEWFSLQKSFLSLILKDYVVGILENDRLFGATLLQ